jgi:hypothetical protein
MELLKDPRPSIASTTKWLVKIRGHMAMNMAHRALLQTKALE